MLISRRGKKITKKKDERRKTQDRKRELEERHTSKQHYFCSVSRLWRQPINRPDRRRELCNPYCLIPTRMGLQFFAVVALLFVLATF